MNILITAPSLNEADNISGISTMVRSIITSNKSTYKFFHFKIGNKDGETKSVRWALMQITLLPRMIMFVKKHKINIIHLNTDFTKTSIFRDFAIFFCLKLIINKKIFIHIHGGYMLMNPPKKKSFYGFLILMLLKYSDVNIVLTKSEQTQIKVHFKAVSEILPNAVSSLKKVPSFKDISGKINIIFFGKILEAKGVLLITEAFAQLGKLANQFIFFIYGAGPDLPILLKRLRAIDNLEYEYKGIVKDDEKWNALGNAHIFILPSYSEGLPLAMLEAMQSGCIPIVSNEPSMTEVVEDKVNGFVVRKGDVQEIKIVLEEILQGTYNLSSISTSAKLTILKNYDISKYMDTLISIYDKS